MAVSRTVAVDEDPGAVVSRWTADRARPWATMLVVQTQPARADHAAHLRTVTRLGRRRGALTGVDSRTATV